MFEEDNEGYGLYGFNNQTFDPQATNAINTELFTTLQPLTKTAKNASDYDKKVAELSRRLCRQTFLKMEGTAPFSELLQQDLELFDSQ
jgi:hypothetical protein